MNADEYERRLRPPRQHRIPQAAERDRERELADALGRALEAAQGRLGYHLSDLCGVPPCWCGLDAARDAIDEALRQWREARKPDTGTPGG